MAQLIFKNPTKEQLKHIYKAENELAEAGVIFDTGKSIGCEGEVLTRDWELDWSLIGAEIKEN